MPVIDWRRLFVWRKEEYVRDQRYILTARATIIYVLEMYLSVAEAALRLNNSPDSLRNSPLQYSDFFLPGKTRTEYLMLDYLSVPEDVIISIEGIHLRFPVLVTSEF